MRTITDHLSTIDGVSESLAATIAEQFPTYEDLAAATTDDLRAIKGVGPVLATRIQAAAIEASPAAAAKSRTDRAAAAARSTTTGAATSPRETGRRASTSVAERADKSATAAKAAASRARDKAAEVAEVAEDARETAAATTDTAAEATRQANQDFAASIERRSFGPITLPADLPWPVNFALDATEAVVGAGLKVTTGVLQGVGRKLR